MLNMFKIFYSIIKTYKKDILKIFFFEIYFFIKHSDSSIKILIKAFFDKERRNTIGNSFIPCPLYYALIIAEFINKKKIKSILDLGSGHGRLTNFLSYKTNAKINGYEFDKEIYKKSLQVKNKDVVLKQRNILKINYEINSFDCFIFSDPLKYKKDLEKVVKKICQIKQNNKFFIIFININKNKNKFMKKKKLIKQHISSVKKNIKFYYFD
jgi:SAM-dependent methyltransferase|tara:strand:+ start:1959 stop:2591 length:633 start_codon:yes stop_codon:yes gene_type:complete